MSEGLNVEAGNHRRHWSLKQLRAVARDGEIEVSDILPEDSGATHASFDSVAQDYRASIPLDLVRRQGVILIDEDDRLRLRVRQGRTLCWNVKDVGSIRLTVGPEEDSVPANPPH
ncbi:MAG: hypothetical protein WB239_09425 [Acidimicrobiia bacterium]